MKACYSLRRPFPSCPLALRRALGHGREACHLPLGPFPTVLPWLSDQHSDGGYPPKNPSTSDSPPSAPPSQYPQVHPHRYVLQATVWHKSSHPTLKIPSTTLTKTRQPSGRQVLSAKNSAEIKRWMKTGLKTPSSATEEQFPGAKAPSDIQKPPFSSFCISAHPTCLSPPLLILQPQQLSPQPLLIPPHTLSVPSTAHFQFSAFCLTFTASGFRVNCGWINVFHGNSV